MLVTNNSLSQDEMTSHRLSVLNWKLKSTVSFKIKLYRN